MKPSKFSICYSNFLLKDKSQLQTFYLQVFFPKHLVLYLGSAKYNSYSLYRSRKYLVCSSLCRLPMLGQPAWALLLYHQPTYCSIRKVQNHLVSRRFRGILFQLFHSKGWKRQNSLNHIPLPENCHKECGLIPNLLVVSTQVMMGTQTAIVSLAKKAPKFS